MVQRVPRAHRREVRRRVAELAHDEAGRVEVQLGVGAKQRPAADRDRGLVVDHRAGVDPRAVVQHHVLRIGHNDRAPFHDRVPAPRPADVEIVVLEHGHARRLLDRVHDALSALPRPDEQGAVGRVSAHHQSVVRVEQRLEGARRSGDADIQPTRPAPDDLRQPGARCLGVHVVPERHRDGERARRGPLPHERGDPRVVERPLERVARDKDTVDRERGARGVGGHGFVRTKSLRTSTSSPVPPKHRSASAGVQTIGSPWTLKDVLIRTG